MPSSRRRRTALAVLLVCAACAPTLSKPRGAEHLDALARAEAEQHAGRYEQALVEYQRAADAAERRVDRDEALYRKSRVLARMGRTQDALAVCDALAQIRPAGRRTERARLDAARYRLELGDVANAEAKLEAIVLELPDSGAAKSALRLLMQRHVDDASSRDEALAWVRTFEGKVKDPSAAETLMYVEAELLIQLGRRDEAVTVLERQVERFPYPQGARWDDALWRLADLALDAKDPKRAVRYLERMLEAHEESYVMGSYTRPFFPKAALRIARIQRDELHDAGAATAAYERVRREFPKSLVADDAQAELAELYLERGDRDRACELLRDLVAEREVGAARRRAAARLTESCR